MAQKVKYEKIDDKKIHDILTELFIFMLFLIGTNTVADSMQSKYAFHNNKMAKSLFTTQRQQYFTIHFEHIKTIENMYDFINNTYLRILYDNAILNEEAGKEPHMRWKNGALILGAPRIRQLRVNAMNCLHQIKVENMDNVPCYPEYSVGLDNDSFHDGYYKTDASKIWTNSHMYKAGGFSVNLHHRYNDSLDMLSYIYDSVWIDRATRLVVLELNLFYEASEMFQLVKILFELFPTGIISSSCYVQSIPLKCFLHFGHFTFYVGLMFYLIIIYYTLQELCEIYTVGIKSYVNDIHNYADIVLLLTSFMTLAYNIWHLLEVKFITETFDRDPWTYISLDSLHDGWNVYVITMGILTFCAWLKIIRLVSFHGTLKRLAITIKMSFKNILGLFFIYVVTILALAQMGTVFFSDKLENFKSISASVINIIRILMCDFDYMSMHEIQPIIAPIYFLAVVITIYGVLLKLFVAILLATYSEVKSDLFIRDAEVWQMLLNGLKNYFCCGKNKTELNDKMFIDKLVTIDERPEPSETHETKANVEPMRDLREDLAQLTERSFQIEKVLERFASSIELISALQDDIKRRNNNNNKKGPTLS